MHPTAIVDPKAEIDSGAEIGPYCIVGGGVTIRRGTRLFSNVIVDGCTEIGENCLIYPFATIGLPPQDLKYKGEDTKLIIGGNNIIREYVSIHKASVGGDGVTAVGSNNFFMAYVHIAHDCKVGSGVIMANCATLGGHVIVEDAVVLGGLAAIHQFARIGRNAMIGGLTMVRQDVPPFMICSGSEAKLFGPNSIGLKRHGFTDAEISALKSAYKILFRQKLPLNKAIEKVRAEIDPNRHVDHLLHFIEQSKRGITRSV
ncbi:MAG: acyl-ACP--UDP-N-acetylglucosamine O-acyltransferase [Nitrospirae bacterium]|nr:acyl-ACP--UDP-N-acetylglucosamine O-acyltransferase [Nitrospirota bacterium]